MSRLHVRILTKIASIWFALTHASSFKSIGHSAFLFRPFRIDGAEGIDIGSNMVLRRGFVAVAGDLTHFCIDL